jgi:pSer/pThr/pTyr-binding forkhead associated (FHA) protein
MAKLILSLDGMVLREYPLTKERTTIGRKPHNDIVIDNLAVSGEHAMIMTILNDSFLEDLGSTNGTLVNGQPVKKHFLQNNDVIELGKYKLKYMAEGVQQAASPDFEKTMVLRGPPGGAVAGGAPGAKAPEESQPVPKNFGDTVVNPELMQSQNTGGSLRDAARQAAGTTGSPAAAETAQPAPPSVQPAPPGAQPTAPGQAAAPAQPAPAAQPAAPAAQPAAPAAQPTAPTAQPAAPAAQAAAPGGIQGTIQILSGPSAGKELPLSKPLTTLGKPGVQVAVIAKRPQGYFITHVEGASFPVVNGKHLDAQAHPLNDHDVIELAGVKMEFFLKPPA